MKCNVGEVERVIRITLGVILLLVAYLAGLPGWGTVLAYVLGAVALITGAVSFCPLWALFGDQHLYVQVSCKDLNSKGQNQMDVVKKDRDRPASGDAVRQT